MKFLVTGCGRSGTNYVADRLVASKVNCGHENVFSVTGPLYNFDRFEGDSSWFAAPFISAKYSDLKVLHIVREPRSVIESFHRLGVCKRNRFRHFSGGRGLFSTMLAFNFNASKIRNRIDYVNAIRLLLAEHTTCWAASDEFHRLCVYWYQWNKLIEHNSHRSGLPYLRLRLDEVDDRWNDVERFLEIEKKITPGPPINKKTGYRPVREFTQALTDEVVELAKVYGFDV